jgi:DNA mismatch repair protein MutL
MPRTIHVLPDSVANQIAAGEVVERPASVVKELVENSLDAEASRVEVRIEGGGKRRIRVLDDGAGMGREDALLSLDRHATSKIRAAEDLRSVASFGFRGEALPSIASVSRFTLETRHGAEEVGTRIRARGGRITAVEDLPRTEGTTVVVESLFFNAPARARFLRSPTAEARAVSEILTPLALANPTVAFSLHSDERTLLELAPARELARRVADLWGEDEAGALVPVRLEGSGMWVEGLIQRPDATRPGFRRAALFVEGRPFREAALLKAVDRAYRTTVPPEHRPWVVLFLHVPGGGVDVNVHPTKAEVRFRNRSAVEALIEAAVRRGLEGEESAATFSGSAAGEPLQVREPTPGRGGVTAGGPGERFEGVEGEGTAETGATGVGFEGRGEPGSRKGRRRTGPVSPTRADEEAGRNQMALFVPWSGARDPGKEEAGDEAAPQREEHEVPLLERPRLWQIHRSWILAEVRDGLLLIDQHAAHERILFERIMARFGGQAAEGQRLLFPLTIRLTPAEYDLVEDLKGLLHRTGFEVEGFGGDTVIVHTVPAPHPHFEAERCFREMVEELTHGSELVRSARNQHERVAMSFACKGAIKAGQPLDEREMQELFDQLFATELPFHDVHGRPTTVRLSRAELERKFGR